MQPLSRTMDLAQIQAAFIANYRGFAARLGELPDATLHQHSGVTWVDTGVPLTLFNGVAHADMAEDAADATIAAIISHFRTRNLPFHWSLGPIAQDDLEQRLLAHGLTFDEIEPAMVADLDALGAAPPSIANFSIVPVKTPAQMLQWVRVNGFSAPAWIIEHGQGVYEGLREHIPSEEFTAYLGLYHGEPVGTVYLYCQAGVAAVHAVVTLPEVRRRGIGAALTWYALVQARVLGYHVAVLTASPYGVNIYRRLGFREFGSASTYEWRPSAD